MKRIIELCFALLLIAAPVLVNAAELHMWVDEKGVKHITEDPPEGAVKIIGKETYTPPSKEEIRQFQQQQKQYEQDLEARRRYNRQQEESEKRFNARMDQEKEVIKQRELERKQEAIERSEDLEARNERLRAFKNRDFNELKRLRLKDELRQNERDINKYNDLKDR